MLKKQLLLFLLGIFLLAGFFMLPANKEWFNDRIVAYYHDFPSQVKRLDRESRMRTRFGNSYIFSKSIASQVREMGGDRNALVLLPPPSYFSSKGVNYYTPEPAVFYYYTDVKTTWCHYSDAITAGWYAVVRDNKVVVEKVSDQKSLRDTISAFLKWKKTND